MASIYTHNKFGEEVLKILPNKFKDIIKNNEEFYFLAQQGPDLFFFNTSFIINKNHIGSKIHSNTFKDFLDRNTDIIKNCKSNKMLSYFIGSICHFILDSKIHPTVNRLVSENFSHMDIETELDRYFMYLDSHNPTSFNTAKLIPYNRDICENIGPFYKSYSISNKDIKNSIKGFIFYKKIFFNSSKFKEIFLLKTMNKLNLKAYSGQIMKRETPLGANDLNNELSPIFYQAIDKTPMLIENVFNYVFEKEDLMSDFNFNYEGELWKN